MAAPTVERTTVEIVEFPAKPTPARRKLSQILRETRLLQTSGQLFDFSFTANSLRYCAVGALLREIVGDHGGMVRMLEGPASHFYHVSEVFAALGYPEMTGSLVCEIVRQNDVCLRAFAQIAGELENLGL